MIDLSLGSILPVTGGGILRDLRESGRAVRHQSGRPERDRSLILAIFQPVQ